MKKPIDWFDVGMNMFAMGLGIAMLTFVAALLVALWKWVLS